MTNVLALQSAQRTLDITSISRRRLKIIVCLLVCLAGCTAALVYRMRVDRLEWRSVTLAGQPTIKDGQVALLTPGYVLTAELAEYTDELFAYLMFDHLRHRTELRGMTSLLTYSRSHPEKPYRLVIRAPDDLVAAIATVESLQLAGSAPSPKWRLSPLSKVKDFTNQSELFDSAYNLPVRRKLETLPRSAIANYLRRFIQFKSNTDPRIRRQLEPIPKALSAEDAQRLAADIITVADFYSLPLEFLLGIGAMENNYMDVRGDLTHTVWKRKAAPDDIIVERRRGRVRTLNDSAGVWQITRETLRYAHTLYERDKRDYELLPQHLRPTLDFRINEVSPAVLTTYAGLILRDLLDRFEGDVTLAVSAYNGGPGRPNLRYGAGVHRAASHARRVLEQAAALNGESVVSQPWIRRR